MKRRAVKLIRALLPEAAVRLSEETYRRSRIHLTAAAYGFPAKNMRVLAVTGTNGKTTTMTFLNEILKTAGFKTAMFTTAVIEIDGTKKLNDLNATVGLTSQMQHFFKTAKRAGVDFVLLEVTSHALDQHKLDGVPIEAAIMTNLTQDHLDYHKTMKRYAEAKGKLFAKKPRFMVLNHDDEWFHFFDEFQADEQKITYGQSDESGVKITRTKLSPEQTNATIEFGSQKQALEVRLPGLYNLYNAVAASSLAWLLGVSPQVIAKGVKSLEEVPGRFERVQTSKPFDIVVDYAHTPDALEKLLTAARAITKQRVLIVFGATGDRDKGKRPIMGEIVAGLADHIFLTDDESYSEDPASIRKAVLEGIQKAPGSVLVEEVADRRDAIEKALKAAKKGDIVLITGMGHEQFRIVNGKRLPWNDAAVVRELTK